MPLFTELPRRVVFSETRLPPYSISRKPGFLRDLQEKEGRARQDSNLRPALFVVRFFERDAVGYGAKPRILGVFGGMRHVAAVSGSRQRSRQRYEAASQ
jgi:hypothetical protein